MTAKKTASEKPQKPAGTINTLSAYQSYTDDVVKRGDGYTMKWVEIEEEPGFNPRDYNSPRVVQHIRTMANDYKKGDTFPHLFIVVRNGTPYVRDGHCRLRAIALAVSEGAKIDKIPVVELKGDEVAQAKVVLKTANGLNLSALERAEQYAKFYAWNWTDAQIAAEFSVSGEHVRQNRAMLELPFALKKLINEGVIKPTLALELYKTYGSESTELVIKAVETRTKEIEEEQKQHALAVLGKTQQLQLNAGEADSSGDATQQNDQQAPGSGDSDVEAQASSAGDAEKQINDGAKEQQKPEVKISKKHVLKVVGSQAKLSKKVVESMTKSFTVLGDRLDNIRIDGDKFLMELSADDVEMLKALKAAMKPAPSDEDESDANEKQLDILNSQEE